jgi:hypothetical protein
MIGNTQAQYAGGSPTDDPCNKFTDHEIFPEPDVSFSMIEEKMKEQTPDSLYRLCSPRYRFLDPQVPTSIEYMHPGSARLYYSVPLISNGSQLIEIVGVDPDVRPPKFEMDYSILAKSLKNSRFKNEAIFFYTVFVDENGIIFAIENSDPEGKAILPALSKATVTAPGTRKGKPVPTAVILAIPVR